MANRSDDAATEAPSVPGVYRAIVGVSADLAKVGIPKDQRNQQQGYQFRGIDSVMNAMAPLLAKHGLVILPRMLSRSVVEHASKSGGVLFYVTVEMEFDFVCAADGSRHTVRMFGEAMDSADKATNKSASAAYKYAAFQTFCIPTEGDDADATTPEPVIQIREAPASTSAREKPAAATVENRGTSHESRSPDGDGHARPPIGSQAAVRQSVGTVATKSVAGSEPADSHTREPGEDDELPAGALLVTSVEVLPTKNPNVKKALVTFSDLKVRSTINTALINSAEQARVERLPVWIVEKQSKFGLDLVTLSREAIG
jgi:hypothetical protein